MAFQLRCIPKYEIQRLQGASFHSWIKGKTYTSQESETHGYGGVKAGDPLQKIYPPTGGRTLCNREHFHAEFDEWSVTVSWFFFCLSSACLIVYVCIGCFVNGGKSTCLSKGVRAALRRRLNQASLHMACPKWLQRPLARCLSQQRFAQYSGRSCLMVMHQSGDLIITEMKTVSLFYCRQPKLEIAGIAVLVLSEASFSSLF